MAAFDLHTNFAISTVATAPTPATSGTSLSIPAADGFLFPAAAFNVVIWTAGTNPTSSNAEIVRVASKSGANGQDWVIVRVQEGSAARAITVGDLVGLNMTAKTFTDIENVISGVYDQVTLGVQLFS